MGRVVVHQGSPESVGHVVHYLQEAGIDAELIDQPNFIVLMISFGTYKSRVAVPLEQAEAAHLALERWSEESRATLQNMAGQLGRQVLWASLVSLGVAAWLLWRSAPEQLGLRLALGLPASWLIAFTALAIRAQLRRRA